MAEITRETIKEIKVKMIMIKVVMQRIIIQIKSITQRIMRM